MYTIPNDCYKGYAILVSVTKVGIRCNKVYTILMSVTKVGNRCNKVYSVLMSVMKVGNDEDMYECNERAY